MELVNKALCKISVSSVLDQNGKEYGKQFLNDGNEDTCWYSDQGNPQYIKLKFAEKQIVEEKNIEKFKLKIQFQGGFAGQKCFFKTGPNSSLPFFPEDSNDLQEFEFEAKEDFEQLEVEFESSTDFYGRVIVYQLSILALPS
ncbi:Oidioi.mRNA.OKI2018_I69.chr2.g5502.t1.cds [Oikopleura dioica]|uniref:Oidioi.mRNA.OKI2018_I69.chr2.g5502.t1.cds n=1 Tax=Oikopleura dioica TaxID=34765 RepID=A0ABN7T4U5_OIKDI|nr:Oidioi.mRNA.OKI2018_I69.chr2.g5502.t1.cds [Oikopleura dioica]